MKNVNWTDLRRQKKSITVFKWLNSDDKKNYQESNLEYLKIYILDRLF